MTTLPAAFASSAARNSERVALTSGQTHVTYGDLAARVRAVAKGLIAAGLGHGDRVGVWAVNRIEWPVVGLAVQSIGGVVVPVSTRLKAGEVATIMRRAGARVMFTDPAFGSYDFVRALEAEDIPSLERIVVFDERPAGGLTHSLDALTAAGSAIPDQSLEARMAAVRPQDLCDILFTSGTTGTPKGVPVRHEQSLQAAASYQTILGLSPSDVYGVIYPFAHNAGYRAGWQMGLLHGARVVPVQTYDPAEILALIDRERISVFPAVPTVFQSLLDCPERAKFDLSSLRIANTGATTIPIALIEQMRSELGARDVITGYGLTEACGLVTHTRVGDPDAIVSRTTGKPVPGIEVVCLDAAGRSTPPGTPGEIAVRGRFVMGGYYQDEEATRAAFTDDGFLRTGDVGTLDAEGNLTLTDRIKDMYIVGGFNCYPVEIENGLRSLTGVADVAVVGVSDARLGQVGRAFVVRRAGSSLSEDDVIGFAKTTMANYKAPRSVVFLDALPLNPTGKVAKTTLREWGEAIDGSDQAVS